VDLMAVDTRNKRFSIVGLDLPYIEIVHNPDGTIGSDDRAQALGLYSGLVPAESAVWTVVTPESGGWGAASTDDEIWTPVTPESGGWT
jgi:hypothetical protein